MFRGGFLKRDRAVDHEILTSRLVDRALRPLFKSGWCNETQLLEWVVSYDGVNSTEPLAITAASAALAISGTKVSSSSLRLMQLRFKNVLVCVHPCTILNLNQLKGLGMIFLKRVHLTLQVGQVPKLHQFLLRRYSFGKASCWYSCRLE